MGEGCGVLISAKLMYGIYACDFCSFVVWFES